MTITEKIEMYKNKRNFIKDISKAFENKPSKTTVTSVDYEVYRKDLRLAEEVNERTVYFAEYIIVNFFGGAKSVRTVNGNSNSANFRVIGELIDGGYYDEVRDYETILDRGFTQVVFEEEETLESLLSKPMTHISDVHKCFDYCRDGNDVEKVIGMIPSCFGTFDVYYNEDGETFLITNECEVDDYWDETEYYFYKYKK